jgi:two-component system, response regulator
MTDTRVLLLVEDNPNDEELTLRAFRKVNVANPIVVARDGAEAIDWMFGTGAHAGRDVLDTPAVILLDLKLPKMSGLDVLKLLRADERTKFVPVVVLTTSNEERDVIESYALGANSYIRKPVNFTEFIQAVAQLGVYWLALNQGPPRR